MADPAEQPAGAPAKKSNKTMITCVILALVLGCGGVGVIGILMLIAIPNFKKFECKSLQSEAKANLRSLYSAERAFQAEYGFYTSDLVVLNFNPGPNPRYVYGFYYPLEESPSNAPAGHDPDHSDTTNDDVVAAGHYSLDKVKTQDGDSLTVEDLPEDSYVEKEEFVAAAVGDIRADSFGNLDTWTADEKGEILNVENDCE